MKRPRPPGLAARLQAFAIAADDRLDAARTRLRARFGGQAARRIVAYRGHGDATSVHLRGRVFADAAFVPGGDRAWHHLHASWHRFESDEVAGAKLVVTFRGQRREVTSDGEGYFDLVLPTPGETATDALWEDAHVALLDGSAVVAQPVLQVGASAQVGVISDIDDTILDSQVLSWTRMARLTLLRGVHARRPLAGVAGLYRALQGGSDGARANPVFYVSSSPWNLYDLLDGFIAHNAIPAGPLFLRDLGLDPGKFIKSPGHGHKLENARLLIRRYPALRWILVGDSGQADAELYAAAARDFGDRIAAIYIRDVAPGVDDPRDRFVDGFLSEPGAGGARTVAGTGVPMLRVRDSLEIGEHAASLGLLPDAALDAIARDVSRERTRPTPAQVAVAAAATTAPVDRAALPGDATTGDDQSASSATQPASTQPKRQGPR